MNREQKKTLILILISASLYVAGFVTHLQFFFWAAYVIAGGPVIVEAAIGLRSKQFLDENFLMALASIGAIWCGQLPEAVAVMLFNMVGEFFEDKAVSNSRNSISELMNLAPDTATRLKDGKTETVLPESLEKGDIIIVKPGEKIAIDGTIVEGASSISTAALTGESAPLDVETGSQVLSGSVNLTGLVKVRTDSLYEDSTVSKVLDLVENSVESKAPVERFITKFAKYYTPAVVAAAAAIAIIPGIITGDFKHFIYVAAEFLVVSCPCALVISVPLSLFGGIGAASRQGILVKGSDYLQALSRTGTVAFDKTGTLTEGSFHISNMITAEGFTEDQLLTLAEAAERFSNHPVASAINQEHSRRQLEKTEDVTGYTEIPGRGISCTYGSKLLIAGNLQLMKENNIDVPSVSESGTAIYIATDGKWAGTICAADTVRESSKKMIEALHRMGIENTVMLTGDRKDVAEKTAKSLGISQVRAELLPGDKVSAVEGLLNDKKTTVFIGDGINDAPVLARADIGIAMGAGGSDAAIEAADAVILTDDLSKLVTLIKISKKTLSICKENIIFALAVKFLVMILAPMGLVTMWACIFADVGVSIIAILNSIRTLKTGKN